MKVLLLTLGILAAGAAALLVAGRLGCLTGTPPADLGVRDGRLKPPSATRNSVSSQAALHPAAPQRRYAEIAPLRCAGDPATAMSRLVQVLEAMPGARIVEARPDYVYAQFTTRWLHFVDDAEFRAWGARISAPTVDASRRSARPAVNGARKRRMSDGRRRHALPPAPRARGMA